MKFSIDYNEYLGRKQVVYRKAEYSFDTIPYIPEIDFDIAIIGCGAYGMPLAAMLKKAGKQAIHLGGATQLLFGIKGRRWEENYPSKIATFFNEYWVYPAESEKPKNASTVEMGCYWK